MAAAVCALVGLVAIVIGYLGVRGEADIVLQLPHLASGGVGGLALTGIGATALADMRGFLENAQVDLEIVPSAGEESLGLSALDRRLRQV